jgi:hypothetical protein
MIRITSTIIVMNNLFCLFLFYGDRRQSGTGADTTSNIWYLLVYPVCNSKHNYNFKTQWTFKIKLKGTTQSETLLILSPAEVVTNHLPRRYSSWNEKATVLHLAGCLIRRLTGDGKIWYKVTFLEFVFFAFFSMTQSPSRPGPHHRRDKLRTVNPVRTAVCVNDPILI